MSTCTFFGHRNTPNSVKPVLKEQLIKLIEENDVYHFLIGNQGKYDALCLSVLKELKQIYPYIEFSVVLAYMPTAKRKFDNVDYNITIIPEGIEKVPQKFRIPFRNDWMIKNSDYVLCFVNINGGASMFMEKAKRKNKIVINLAQII